MRNRMAQPPSTFRRIVLATDLSSTSTAAFRVAVDLARECHARLTILHVAENPILGSARQVFDSTEPAHSPLDVQHALDALLTETAAKGIAAEGHIAHGSTAESILHFLAIDNADVAVLGTRAIHGLKRLAFGSVAETVLRKAPCPVITVGPAAAASSGCPPNGPIVFATDFDSTTATAVACAASLGTLTRSSLHSVHVLPRVLEPHGTADVIPIVLSEALRRIVEEHTSLGVKPVCALTYGNEVSNAVVEYARQQHARLIVLGVRQTSLAAAHMPAHITYRVITEAPCPVLTIAFAPGEAALPRFPLNATNEAIHPAALA